MHTANLTPPHCNIGMNECDACLNLKAQEIAEFINYDENEAVCASLAWYTHWYPYRSDCLERAMRFRSAVITICRKNDLHESDFHSPAGLRIQYADAPKVSANRSNHASSSALDALGRSTKVVYALFGLGLCAAIAAGMCFASKDAHPLRNGIIGFVILAVGMVCMVRLLRMGSAK